MNSKNNLSENELGKKKIPHSVSTFVVYVNISQYVDHRNEHGMYDIHYANQHDVQTKNML